MPSLPVPPTILCTHGRRARTARVGSNRPIILARHCAPAKISSPAEKSNSGLALAGVECWREGCTPRQLAHGVCQREFDGEPLRGCCKRGGELGVPKSPSCMAQAGALALANWRADAGRERQVRSRARGLTCAGEHMCSATLPRGFLGVSHDVVVAFERGEWHEESPRTQKVQAHEQRLVRFTYSPWRTR